VAADAAEGPGAGDAPAAAVAARASAPAAGPALARLAELLPDDAWLTTLRLSETEVELSGYAAEAAGLIPLIDADPDFATPRFLSPVVREAPGRERFALAARREAAR
jgi:hypothetical protein